MDCCTLLKLVVSCGRWLSSFIHLIVDSLLFPPALSGLQLSVDLFGHWSGYLPCLRFSFLSYGCLYVLFTRYLQVLGLLGFSSIVAIYLQTYLYNAQLGFDVLSEIFNLYVSFLDLDKKHRPIEGRSDGLRCTQIYPRPLIGAITLLCVEVLCCLHDMYKFGS